jgi:class 3 adenylate cyclase
MRCSGCHAEVPAGNKFCLECGAELPVPCAACGKLNPVAAKFCGGCGVRLARGIEQTSIITLPPAVKPPFAVVERRQLTVMFCDLVGSTALSARMDPEDLRDVIAAYHRCVGETVEQFEGFVAKYMGDGVLVYFGYPSAHEDDAEQAVQAGLALVSAVQRLPTPEPLRVRIGIATGFVIVGDLTGSGAAQEQAVIGETPNLAARLQAVAEPGSVIVAETTHKLLAGLFEYQGLNAVALKGFSEPLHAWRVLRESAIESRFDALRGELLAPLVGRDEEISVLLRRWKSARVGEGRVVLVSGEPGIGKSRLHYFSRRNSRGTNIAISGFFAHRSTSTPPSFQSSDTFTI